jgi:hypothetical protein
MALNQSEHGIAVVASAARSNESMALPNQWARFQIHIGRQHRG